MEPTDPLARTEGRQRALFEALAKVAHGFSAEEAMGAALNLLVNALRQAHDTQAKALDDYDRAMSGGRNLLATHYDALGRRRNVFPFHQTVEVPLLKAKSVFPK